MIGLTLKSYAITDEQAALAGLNLADDIAKKGIFSKV